MPNELPCGRQVLSTQNLEREWEDLRPRMRWENCYGESDRDGSEVSLMERTN